MRQCKYILLFLAVVVSTACVKYNDLYIRSAPELLLKPDWSKANVSSMNGATAMFYKDGTPSVELMATADSISVSIAEGYYDILVFNGLMYSEEQSHLDYIRYRNSDDIHSFEAYVTEADSRNVFNPNSEHTYVNNPDIIASSSMKEFYVEGATDYQIKYENGKNVGYEPLPSWIEVELPLEAIRITKYCTVILDVLNARSARSIRGTLKGFSGSVFLASRMPSHSDVSHQFVFSASSLTSDGQTTQISTLPFTTFGPPLDLVERSYTLSVNVLLTDGTEMEPIELDVTAQVEAIIEQIKKEFNEPMPTAFSIHGSIELPIVISDDIDVGVGDWGDTEIIPVPIM